jgi:hypothetical protein
MKSSDKPRPETQWPRGSHIEEGFSEDSMMKEVEVIVKIRTRIKLPSN